jgi:hypothetical protein
MKLDNLGKRMPTAIAHYQSHGLVDTNAQVHSAEADVRHMRLTL